jgi:hypothetical protein
MLTAGSYNTAQLYLFDLKKPADVMKQVFYDWEARPLESIEVVQSQVNGQSCRDLLGNEAEDLFTLTWDGIRLGHIANGEIRTGIDSGHGYEKIEGIDSVV